MASGFRGFVVFVLASAAAGLGLAAIGLTHDAPGRRATDNWHVFDVMQAATSGFAIVGVSVGDAGCGDGARLLYVDGAHVAGAQYAGNPTDGLQPIMTVQPYLSLVTVPPDATPTGWGNGERTLWLSSDYAYLARGRYAEAWPSLGSGLIC